MKRRCGASFVGSSSGCAATGPSPSGGSSKGRHARRPDHPDEQIVACVVDLNPNKQGRYLPGTGHPIVAPRGMAAFDVKTAVLTNPNYFHENTAIVRDAGLDVTLVDLMRSKSMRIEIDTEAGSFIVSDGETRKKAGPLHGRRLFGVVAPVGAGWLVVEIRLRLFVDGRPIIQLPEDIVRMQEVIYAIRPDVIVETGVAHGGSLIFYASLFKAMGQGRVIGVDIEIRAQNRRAIETHELSSYITFD